jgi:LacI family transcriptional regulator
MSMKKTRFVAVLIGSTRAWHRRAILGVVRYRRVSGQWKIFAEPTIVGDRRIPPEALRADGAIVDIIRREDAKPLLDRGIPMVNLTTTDELPEAPHVSNQGKGIGQLAFDHLHERGFRHFACCATGGYSYVRSRYFTASAKAAGFECQTYNPPPGVVMGLDEDRAALAAWIKSLPKPVGILAVHDVRGRHVIDACNEHGIHVPDEVGVMGVDDELPHCEMCEPPLSSVRTNAERIGFEAAALLNRLMDGEPAPTAPLLIPPTHIVTRQSTDALVTKDELVAKAIRFIRQYACDGIDVEDVLNHVIVSRSVLDRRMTDAFGRTPHEEIIHVRIGHARTLITETNLSMSEIAEHTGFNYAENMGRVFRKKLGRSPGSFREEMKER